MTPACSARCSLRSTSASASPPISSGSPARPRPSPRGTPWPTSSSAAGVPVVLGGSHVSFRVEEALQHAPYVVRGEGQQTMLELVDALERGGSLEEIAGLSWRDGLGEAHHNPARSHCSQTEFERLPIPDLSLIEGHERLQVKSAMTQWGCPYDCEFCSVTAQFSRVVRHRRTDQVLAELAGLCRERSLLPRRQLRRQQAPHRRAAAGDGGRGPDSELRRPDAGGHRAALRAPRQRDRPRVPGAALHRRAATWRWSASRASPKRTSPASASARAWRVVRSRRSRLPQTRDRGPRHVRRRTRLRRCLKRPGDRRLRAAAWASTPSS